MLLQKVNSFCRVVNRKGKEFFLQKVEMRKGVSDHIDIRLYYVWFIEVDHSSPEWLIEKEKVRFWTKWKWKNLTKIEHQIIPKYYKDWSLQSRVVDWKRESKVLLLLRNNSFLREFPVWPDIHWWRHHHHHQRKNLSSSLFW